MKYSLIALAATAICGASAASHNHRRHNHNDIFKRFEQKADDCKCSTYVTSYVVPVTSMFSPTPAGPVDTPVYSTDSPAPTDTPTEAVTTKYLTNVQTSTAYDYVTATEYEPVPTPEVVTYTQPGTYTIPAKTVVVTATETGVYPETTVLVPGKTETYGGVTTIVETSTVVTCPYVAVETTDGITVSKIYETVYECPTAGTYTIGAITTVPTETTTVEYGVPTEYLPGTYVQPEITTTITKTNVVVTCPYSTIHPTETSETPEYTAVPTPAETPDYPVEESEIPVYTSKATPFSTTSYKPTTSSAVPKSTATPEISGGSGKYWAVTYSPYADDGTCKKAADVATDIADIASKGFSNVRIYSTECDGLKNVGDACRANGVGMVVGLFIKAGGISTCAQDLEDLTAWNGWDMVKAVIVGNEAIFNGYITAGGLVDYMTTVRETLKAGPGYTGPISTAETVGILEANPALCDACDFVGVNIQPYFDGQRTASEAGAFLKTQLAAAEKVCGGKEGYVLEAGWPSAGASNNKAVASPENQKIAVESYEENAPGHIAYFTYRNDLWKAAGIEQNFGCASVL
ncbi:glycoside hydrolase superfamily [Tricharina praecox]|uniref:glycoside hydrolase superfamily n=1 Tax=Tricharina praecox TaxID=43433 RepID=UPI00221FEA9A|nr:glycoside hydrolase superfamily [Tricharina praecox]KAI5842090.1 glycoside hydrolase superfamily [Tricharina praecox]